MLCIMSVATTLKMVKYVGMFTIRLYMSSKNWSIYINGHLQAAKTYKKRENHWIGLRENRNWKPWFLPSNWSGFPVNFPIIQFYDKSLGLRVPNSSQPGWSISSHDLVQGIQGSQISCGSFVSQQPGNGKRHWKHRKRTSLDPPSTA